MILPSLSECAPFEFLGAGDHFWRGGHQLLLILQERNTFESFLLHGLSLISSMLVWPRGPSLLRIHVNRADSTEAHTHASKQRLPILLAASAWGFLRIFLGCSGGILEAHSSHLRRH